MRAGTGGRGRRRRRRRKNRGKKDKDNKRERAPVVGAHGALDWRPGERGERHVGDPGSPVCLSRLSSPVIG